MKLKPTLKVRKLYVVIQVLLSDGKVGSFSVNEITGVLKNTMQEFMGTFTLAKASPMILHKMFDLKKQSIIIKINHTYVDQLKAAILFIKEIKGKSVIVRSVISSGTLKKANAFEV